MLVELNINELNTKELNTKELNTKELNINELNTNELTTKELSTKELSTNEMLIAEMEAFPELSEKTKQKLRENILDIAEYKYPEKALISENITELLPIIFKEIKEIKENLLFLFMKVFTITAAYQSNMPTFEQIKESQKKIENDIKSLIENKHKFVEVVTIIEENKKYLDNHLSSIDIIKTDFQNQLTKLNTIQESTITTLDFLQKKIDYIDSSLKNMLKYQEEVVATKKMVEGLTSYTAEKLNNIQKEIMNKENIIEIVNDVVKNQLSTSLTTHFESIEKPLINLVTTYFESIEKEQEKKLLNTCLKDDLIFAEKLLYTRIQGLEQRISATELALFTEKNISELQANPDNIEFSITPKKRRLNQKPLINLVTEPNIKTTITKNPETKPIAKTTTPQKTKQTNNKPIVKPITITEPNIKTTITKNPKIKPITIAVTKPITTAVIKPNVKTSSVRKKS